jgi:lipoprotein signal peptidase
LPDKASLFAGKAWFWSLAPVLIFLDLWSKAAVFAHLASTYPGIPEVRRSLSVWEGPLNFSLICWRNTGTIWGIGQEYNLALTIL